MKLSLTKETQIKMNETLTTIFSEYSIYFKIAVILIVTVFVARYTRWLFKKVGEKNTDITGSSITNFKFIQHSLITIIYLVGLSFAIWNIPFLKPIAQSMIAGAGILAIVVGFASQQALGNIISGLFIVIYKPYVISDRITLRTDLRGIVEDITLRHTVIRNFENQRIIIPNSVISNEVLINSNFSDSKICRFIEVGISYTSDIDLAKSIIAEEIESHELSIDVRTEEDLEKKAPRVTVKLINLMDSSVLLRGWAWAENPADAFILQCDVLEKIKKRYDREGIIIPFPQRTISYLDAKKNTDVKN